MRPGPRTRDQLRRFGVEWKQGEHVLITGPTGSGKTVLGRYVDEQRILRGGHVVVFVGKLRPDATLAEDYQGFTRWKRWKKKPRPDENRILLWPDTDRLKTVKEKVQLQREVFKEAMDALSSTGHWTVHVDEGLYTVSNTFLNLGNELAMLHAMGRSSNLTIVTLAQRPAHIPLIVYSSAAHAFVGRMRERDDVKRLSELGGQESGRELSERISALTRHEFLWVPVAPDWKPEVVEMSK